MLDLGCGDGLIGFAALEQLPRGRVIFSDISAELVERCQGTAAELGVAERCEFLVTGADDLGALEDGSVDVVSATGSRSPSLAGACWDYNVSAMRGRRQGPSRDGGAGGGIDADGLRRARSLRVGRWARRSTPR